MKTDQTDLANQRPNEEPGEEPREPYEPPRLVRIGNVTMVSFGTTGSGADKNGKRP